MKNHCNCKYFPEHKLPDNVIATTDAKAALLDADFCLHAVPVQIIPQALGNPYQPFVLLSGPSFALELMNKLPTAMVVASKDKKLAHATQQLLAFISLEKSALQGCYRGRNCRGTKKIVLAIAAGIVEGMNLGNNSMAALVAQGCSEIRWLATKVFHLFCNI
ncbi:NAD-dependent glycerol-3-phosphate dehydrogenase family protein [Populus alba x Populus x berolinensis]|uniref:NAD-dependent glycerol-3-phosphate dehydrogenase family protein n=1 Tax=Populus alba x Populus x berolinensis TaxID=444605 RepID=A0AAD6M066_9ROSI|nr:NAD-dependent glycerol-3-phosphate dehydrogenase family protein [Populus alba x Populus x berolinensis]